jgi:hypothetical protein
LRIELLAVAACVFVRKGRKGRKESQDVNCHGATPPGTTDLLASLSFAFFASFADKVFLSSATCDMCGEGPPVGGALVHAGSKHQSKAPKGGQAPSRRHTFRNFDIRGASVPLLATCPGG